MRDPFAARFLRTRNVGSWAAFLAGLSLALTTSAGTPPLATELRRTAIVEALERVRESVVNIHGEKTLSGNEVVPGAEGDRRVNGMGTGAVIDERGYILTNHHVVEGVEKIQATLADGKTYVARLVSHDPNTDLAVIKIDVPHKLPVAPIGTSRDLMPGETVIAVGNAFGYENTATRGIISALHRTVQVGDTQKYEDLIQTDASINPGNSGGPLFNIEGEMIGINVAVRVGAQGIGFAIPVDKAMDIAADLMSCRRIDKTWHGIVAQSDPVRVKGGAVVRGLDKESPAAASGLAPGDCIKRVDATPVSRPMDLERALVGHAVGDEVEVAVEREKKEVVVKLTLAALPAGLRAPDEPIWDLLGLRLNTIQPKQFQRYRSRYRGGLTVTAVRPSSPAARQGIRRGDVLVGMHVWETISLDNVQYILSRPDFAELDPLKFYILRGNETFLGHMNVSASRAR